MPMQTRTAYCMHECLIMGMAVVVVERARRRRVRSRPGSFGRYRPLVSRATLLLWYLPRTQTCIG